MQRSGTTLIRQAFMNQSSTYCCGEIFTQSYIKTLEGPEGFYSWIKENRLREKAFAASNSEKDDLIRKYFEYLTGLALKRNQDHIYIDIKFNTILTLMPYADTFSATPLSSFILNLLKQDKVHLLLVQRSNLLSQACSMFISYKDQAWGIEKNASYTPSKIENENVGEIVSIIDSLILQYSWFNHLCNSHFQRGLQINYESLVTNEGSFCTEFCNFSEKIIGSTPQVKLKKNA